MPQRSLNGLTDHVNIQAGANVAITYNEATMVISATAGAGGDDGDWLINGDNISWDIPGKASYLNSCIH